MSGTPEGCPCGAVEELRKLVEKHDEKIEEHDRRLSDGATNFATIKLDLEYIKGRLDSKSRFNSGIVSTIVQSACAIFMAYIAAKIGIA